MRLVPAGPVPVLLAAADTARVEAIVRHGHQQADAGDLAGAERSFRRALSESRSSGTRAELSAVAGLFTWCSHQGRESEMLPLARRLVAIAGAEGSPRAHCRARQAMSVAYANLEDWDRTLHSLPDLDDAIARCPEEDRANFETTASSMRCSALFETGDFAGAESALARADEAAARTDPGPWWRLSRAIMDARLHLARGRAREALRAARRAVSISPTFVAGIDAHVVEAEAALASEGTASAVACAARVMDVVDAAGAELPSPSLVVHAFAGLGRLLHERCGAFDEARRAYGLAAAAVLRRVVQIESSLHDLPELVVRDADDSAALSQFRARFHDERRALMESVARLLREDAAAGRPVAFTNAAGDGWVSVCAWCLRLRPGDGPWVPIGHFVPAHDDALRVTHGICRDCLAITLPG